MSGPPPINLHRRGTAVYQVCAVGESGTSPLVVPVLQPTTRPKALAEAARLQQVGTGKFTYRVWNHRAEHWVDASSALVDPQLDKDPPVG